MPTLDFTGRKPLEEREKLPQPTNSALRALFAGVNKIVIKDDGTYEDKAMSDKILLTILKADRIETFSTLLEIDEQYVGFNCMCSGTCAIELYVDTQIRATIGFHHGVSIRYHNWNTDAGLAKSDALIDFFAEEGFTAPLEDKMERNRIAEAQVLAERKWLMHAPACFSKYWTDINTMNNNYWESLIADLNIEMPEKSEQIITLLQVFGNTENLWSGYPIYEDIPRKILKIFEVSEIISTYLSSDRNYKTRRGFARFLCSFEFKKVRKKYLKYITTELIDELEKCFYNLDSKHWKDEILKLRRQKLTSVQH